MKLRFTALARSDLRSLVLAIAGVDPVRALATNRGLRSALRATAAAPFRCPVVATSGRREIRKKRWRPHVVLFQLQGDAILVLRIVHERSDWASLI